MDRTHRRRINPLRWLAATALLAYLAMAVYQSFKPLPDGVGEAGPPRAAESVAFLADETFVNAEGEQQLDHVIFDEILRLIGQSEQLVVLDMFLFNDFAGEAADGHRPLSAELTEALVRRKRDVPALQAVVITDPLNTLYGGLESSHFTALEEAGVDVILTDLSHQRASNPAWSGLWHWCCRWLGNDAGGGWLPNPLGPGEVTLRSYLELLNFNANHRKTLVVDEGDDWTAMVTSANPHDASSRHGNVALRFSGAAALDLLGSERAVAAYSGHALPLVDNAPPEHAAGQEETYLQVLTEGRIRDALLDVVDAAGQGDRIDIAVFYLSHRPLTDALLQAHRRDVELRVLLDPNRDAFGQKKDGVPNRDVGAELHEAGITVRWCHTRGEQCHSKLLLHSGSDGTRTLILGSANFTRRNLDDLNLETSVLLRGEPSHAALESARQYFERRWGNEDGRLASLPYAELGDRPAWKYWQYRIMEATGLSTF